MTALQINCFQYPDGSHSPLSNFYPSPMVRVFADEVGDQEHVAYPTVEHAFQASKTPVIAERRLIAAAPTPGLAKRLGRRVSLVPQWESIKLGVMLELLRLKFGPGSELAAFLLNTAPAMLIEGNTWGDTYWGTVDGVGQNWLGVLLMAVRAEQQASA